LEREKQRFAHVFGDNFTSVPNEARMSHLCNRPAGRLLVALALMLPLCAAPACADSILSERLTDQIRQYKLNLGHELVSEFESRKKALGAEETSERAEKLRQLLKERAAIYEMIEDVDHAEADFNALTELKPQNPIVYSDRGYFYMRQNRFPDAARDFMTGSRLAPSQAVFSYGAGRAFARMGDYGEAVVHYGEAIRLAPTDSIPRISRAEALLQLARYAEARNDYDLALTLGPQQQSDRLFAYFGRGYASIFTGDFDGAVRDMDAALAVEPNMVRAIVWRGYARERLGQREAALADYEAALRVNPSDDWLRASIKRMRS
jgi:Flp pilus assembly protein TadD